MLQRAKLGSILSKTGGDYNAHTLICIFHVHEYVQNKPDYQISDAKSIFNYRYAPQSN